MGNRIDATRERVEEVLTEPLGRLGLDLEAVELTPAGKRRVLRVAVDTDGGVTLDVVAEATREVSRLLDETDVMGEQPYVLEVTSRGVDRPLTLPRHWRRNADRLVQVALVDGTSLQGRVADSDEDTAGAVRLDVDGARREVAYAEVASALVQVELNRRGPDDLDPAGDDTDDTQGEDD